MVWSIFDSLLVQKEAERLKELTGLAPGSKVGEVGAGAGELSRALAGLVGGQGRVFASEFSKEKQEQLLKMVNSKKLSNVSVVESLSSSCNMEGLNLDMLVMRKVYHHFTDPESMNLSFFKALKPNGKLVVIDFAPKWYLRFSTPAGVPKNRGGHGIKKDLAVLELKAAGFKLLQGLDNWSSGGIYLLLFEK